MGTKEEGGGDYGEWRAEPGWEDGSGCAAAAVAVVEGDEGDVWRWCFVCLCSVELRPEGTFAESGDGNPVADCAAVAAAVHN